MSPEGITRRITEDDVCAAQTTEATKEGLTAVYVATTDGPRGGAEMELKLQIGIYPTEVSGRLQRGVRDLKDCELLAC